MITGIKLLISAMHALRSYEHGNTSPALAKQIAIEIERFLATVTNQDMTRAMRGVLERNRDHPAAAQATT